MLLLSQKVRTSSQTLSVFFVSFTHLSFVPGCTMPRNESCRARLDGDAGKTPVRLAVGERHVVDKRHAWPDVQAASSPAALCPLLWPVHCNCAKSCRAFVAVRLVGTIDVAAQATCESARCQAVKVFSLRARQLRTVHRYVCVVATSSPIVTWTLDWKFWRILLLTVKGLSFCVEIAD